MADVAHPTGGGAAGAHGGAETSRRDFLTLTAAAVAGIGAASALWPFIDTMNPAKDTLAQATTEGGLAPGQVGHRRPVGGRGTACFLRHRPEARDAQAAPRHG